jgi:hypothetical protein
MHIQSFIYLKTGYTCSKCGKLRIQILTQYLCQRYRQKHTCLFAFECMMHHDTYKSMCSAYRAIGLTQTTPYPRKHYEYSQCGFDGASPIVQVLIALPPFSFGFNNRLLKTASVINIVTASGEIGACRHTLVCANFYQYM